MIAQGVQLMVIGMSVVFMFLLVLVACMSLLATIVKLIPGQVSSRDKTAAVVLPGCVETVPDCQKSLEAAIAAVGIHHRRRSQ